MKTLVALPTWALTRMVRPFLPAQHPFKDRRFSLANWHAGQTPLCRGFDHVFWGGIIMAIGWIGLWLLARSLPISS